MVGHMHFSYMILLGFAHQKTLVDRRLNCRQQFNGRREGKKGEMCTHSYVITVCTALETAAESTRTCLRASLWSLSSYSSQRRSVTVHCSANVNLQLSTGVAESICSCNKVSRARPAKRFTFLFICTLFFTGCLNVVEFRRSGLDSGT